jgi:hypothetical protein
VWRVRAGALRDGQELQMDHTRISKLVMGPKLEEPKVIEENKRYHLNSALTNHKKSAIISVNKTAHLIRAESTPNQIPSNKRMIDLKNLNEDIARKQR